MNLKSLLKLKLHSNKCKKEVEQISIFFMITWITSFKGEKSETCLLQLLLLRGKCKIFGIWWNES